MKKPIVSKTRTTIVVLLFIIGLLLVVLAHVSAQTGGTFIISGGVYPSGVVTIWKEDSYYYAKNAYGQQLSFSGTTNASDLIIKTSNLLTNGGEIFCPKGIYEINKGSLRGGTNFGLGCQITQHSITIRGESGATIFVPSEKKQRIFTFMNAPNCSLINVVLDGQNLNTEQFPDSADGLVVFDTGSHFGLIQNCISKHGLNTDGGGIYQANYCVFQFCEVFENEFGLAIAESIGSSIKDNTIYNCYTNGIVVTANNYTWTAHNQILDNTILNCSGNGIEITEGASYNKIKGNNIEGCGRGIVILTAYNEITDNTCKGNTNDGILIGYTGVTTAFHNIISECFALFSTDVTNGYGIREWTGADYNLYTDCYAYGNIQLNISIIGSNSEILSCFNGTSFIAGGEKGDKGDTGEAGFTFTESTFMIYINGSNYQARNYLGQLVYSDTNASYIFESVISDVTTKGVIFIKSSTSTYYLDTEIIIDGKRISFVSDWAMVQSTGGKFAFIFKNSHSFSNGNPFGGIKNLIIDGNSNSGNGIQLDNMQGTLIEDCIIQNVNIGWEITCSTASKFSEGNQINHVTILDPLIGIQFMGSSGTGSFMDTVMNDIRINLETSGTTGIKFNCTNGNVKPHNSRFSNFHIWIKANSQKGIEVIDHGSNVVQLWDVVFQNLQFELFNSPTSIDGIWIGTSLDDTRSLNWLPMPRFLNTDGDWSDASNDRISNSNNKHLGSGLLTDSAITGTADTGFVCWTPDGTKIYVIYVNNAGSVTVEEVTSDYS